MGPRYSNSAGKGYAAPGAGLIGFDVCIPPLLPDLDCGAITHRNFSAPVPPTRHIAIGTEMGYRLLVDR